MSREHQNCAESEEDELLRFDIRQVVQSLLGSTSVYCETYHDDKVMSALKDYEGLLLWLVNRFVDMAKWKDDHRFSAKKIGTKADETLEAVMRIIETYKEDS